MGCGCGKQIISQTPTCDGRCIRLSTIRIGCDDGPTCGETVVIDLSTDTEGPEGSTLSYELTKSVYDGFNSITLTPEGLLTFEKDSIFVSNKESIITYKVKEVGGNLSDTGYLYVCKNDLCKGKIIAEGFECDSCTGDVTALLPNLTID